MENNVDFNERLVEEVRMRPFVYAVAMNDHHHKTKSATAWREISVVLKVSGMS